MGIYTRYATAFLITLLAANSYAATRVTPKSPTPTSDIVKYGVSGQTSFPNGAASWVGPEYVDEHVAGNRFKAGDSPTATSKPVKVKLKSGYATTPAKIASKAKTIMRASVPGLALMAATAGVEWAIDQIPGASISDSGDLQKVPPPVPPSSFKRFGISSGPATYPTATAACKIAAPGIESQTTWNAYESETPGSYICYSHNPFSTPATTYGSIYAVTVNCPAGNNGSSCDSVQPPGSPVPFTETDFSTLESNIATITNNEWLREMLITACSGSLSPGRCYDEMKERDQLFGPTSQLGPKLTSTTTTTNPDGTTTTSSQSTQEKYSYTYSPTYYDVTTTVTTTTNNNGETTITETTDAQPPGEEPQPEEDTEEEQEYTFENSELPSVEPFYEQKYPDGLEGVWNTAKSDFDQSAFVSFLNSFVPSFSGTCPAFSMSFAIGNIANFGTHGFGNLCYALDFVKVCIMLGALFLCRSIVFGG